MLNEETTKVKAAVPAVITIPSAQRSLRCSVPSVSKLERHGELRDTTSLSQSFRLPMRFLASTIA
jgi:hypothetical protein